MKTVDDTDLRVLNTAINTNKDLEMPLPAKMDTKSFYNLKKGINEFKDTYSINTDIDISDDDKKFEKNMFSMDTCTMINGKIYSTFKTNIFDNNIFINKNIKPTKETYNIKTQQEQIMHKFENDLALSLRDDEKIYKEIMKISKKYDYKTPSLYNEYKSKSNFDTVIDFGLDVFSRFFEGALSGAESVLHGGTFGATTYLGDKYGLNTTQRKEKLQSNANAVGLGGYNEVAVFLAETAGNTKFGGKYVSKFIGNTKLSKANKVMAVGGIENALFKTTESISKDNSVMQVIKDGVIGGIEGIGLTKIAPAKKIFNTKTNKSIKKISNKVTKEIKKKVKPILKEAEELSDDFLDLIPKDVKKQLKPAIKEVKKIFKKLNKSTKKERKRLLNQIKKDNLNGKGVELFDEYLQNRIDEKFLKKDKKK